MKRKIIQIDEEKCNGCGICIPNCHEGAMQLIDGKARLISDLFCDGLGACIGHCPEGAIEIIEREAEPYDERKVMEVMVPKGRNTILAHLDHLRDHNETEFLQQAIDYLKENNIMMNPNLQAGHAPSQPESHGECGCPGSMAKDFRENTVVVSGQSDSGHAPNLHAAKSELQQWPVQLHLLNPQASYFKNADVVLAADCAAFAMGNFHERFLKGKSLAIACPKLDSNKESYVQKLTSMIADTRINSLTVVMMEVPCCGGLLLMAQTARTNAGRNIPIKQAIVSLLGEVTQEDWV
ncbi:MAG: 4Fe-4S binding protein [Bacteroidetes bacterium]|nr:4Fe-4S binding protein [Bacteroidota bacterium]